MLDHEAVFRNLANLADTLGATLGGNCEVAVHDLADPGASLRHLAGGISGHEPGVTLAGPAMRAFTEQGDAVRDELNQRILTPNGRVLKSSTAFIRDGAGKVVAALSVNFDITDLLNRMSQIEDFVRIANGSPESSREDYAASKEETVESLIERGVEQMGKQPSTMTRGERLAFIDLLEQMGAFNIKGSVDLVALRLGLSKFTIYNYLKEVRNNQP